MAQGFAFAAWAEENNGIAAVERVGPGYIAQELLARNAGMED